MRDLVIRGSGGLAQEVALLVERINEVNPTWNLLGYVDQKDVGKIKYGYEVLGTDKIFEHLDAVDCVVAVGEPLSRRKVLNELRDCNLNYPTLIDPSVTMSKDTDIGLGCIISPGCRISVDTKIGDYCFINAETLIGHNCKIGNLCTIGPSCNISGGVTMGQGCFVGVRATILQNKRIGDWTRVGACSLVVTNVKDNETVFGIPASKI